MFSTTSKIQKHTMHHTKKIMVKFCLKWLFQQTEIMIKTLRRGCLHGGRKILEGETNFCLVYVQRFRSGCLLEIK